MFFPFQLMAMKGTNSLRKILVIATVNFYKNNIWEILVFI